MSQISSQEQVQDPNWVSIPFVKFSHNSSPYGTRNFTWNHVGLRNDLDFVLRSTRVVDSHGNCKTQFLMKITAGAEILEIQDLGELAQYVLQFDPSAGGENPVQVVVKSPFLAMRYPKSTNTVRRIQLKFHNDSDFIRALNLMKDLGMPITETAPTNNSVCRASVSPAASLFSTASASSFVTAPSIFSTASVSTLCAEPSLLPRLSLKPHIHAFDNPSGHSLSTSTNSGFKVPTRPDTSSSEAHTPSGALPHATPQITELISPPSASSNPTLSPALSDLSSLHNSVGRTPSLYVAQIERDYQVRRLSHPNLQNTSGTDGGCCPNLSLSISQNKSQQRSLSERVQDSERLLSASSLLVPQDVVSELRGSFLKDAEYRNQSYDGKGLNPLDFERPASSPLELSKTVNPWIPPKRDLPFPKIRSSSVSRLPPLPELRSATIQEASTPVLKSVSKRVAQRRAIGTKPEDEELSTEEPPTDNGTKAGALDTRGVVQDDEPSPLAGKSAVPSSRPSSTTSRLPSKAASATTKKRATVLAPTRPASTAKRQKTVDQGTQTQTISGRDHSATTKPIHRDNAPGSAELDVWPPPAPAPPSENYMHLLDAFITKHKARPRPTELWETPGYADTEEDQRQTILNNFICENLENTDFIQLCEDTEQAWRRVGLGM